MQLLSHKLIFSTPWERVSLVATVVGPLMGPNLLGARVSSFHSGNLLLFSLVLKTSCLNPLIPMTTGTLPEIPYFALTLSVAEGNIVLPTDRHWPPLGFCLTWLWGPYRSIPDLPN